MEQPRKQEIATMDMEREQTALRLKRDKVKDCLLPSPECNTLVGMSAATHKSICQLVPAG